MFQHTVGQIYKVYRLTVVKYQHKTMEEFTTSKKVK